MSALNDDASFKRWICSEDAVYCRQICACARMQVHEICLSQYLNTMKSETQARCCVGGTTFNSLVYTYSCQTSYNFTLLYICTQDPYIFDFVCIADCICICCTRDWLAHDWWCKWWPFSRNNHECYTRFLLPLQFCRCPFFVLFFVWLHVGHGFWSWCNPTFFFFGLMVGRATRFEVGCRKSSCFFICLTGLTWE